MNLKLLIEYFHLFIWKECSKEVKINDSVAEMWNWATIFRDFVAIICNLVAIICNWVAFICNWVAIICNNLQFWFAISSFFHRNLHCNFDPQNLQSNGGLDDHFDHLYDRTKSRLCKKGHNNPNKQNRLIKAKITQIKTRAVLNTFRFNRKINNKNTLRNTQ